MGSCISSCCTCCTTPVTHRVQLPEQLETGDLVLFRTASTSAAITRWCTDAPFDHVAMVLRTSEGYRTVECTGQGIGCWVLQERIDDHIIKGVVIRRLQTALTNEMVDELNKFLQSVKHKPYRLNNTLLQRMIRTCLCCQRIGQNDRGLEEWTEETNRKNKELKKKQMDKLSSTAANKYLQAHPQLNSQRGTSRSSPPPTLQPSSQQPHPQPDLEEMKSDGEGDGGDEEYGFELQEGEVPLPPLLPPMHRDLAHQESTPDEIKSPSLFQSASSPSPPPGSATQLPRAPSGTSSTVKANGTSFSLRPSSTNQSLELNQFTLSSTTSTNSTTSGSSSSPPLAVDDPKYRIELKDHEHIKSHYPKPENIDNLHLRSGFFCSSFIAACYMKMGLLPAYPPIDWYLPNTFSSRTAIQPPLINAEFGEETLIAKPTRDTRKTKWTNPYLVKEAEKKQQAQSSSSSSSSVGGGGVDPQQQPSHSHSKSSSPKGGSKPTGPPVRASTTALDEDGEFDNLSRSQQGYMKPPSASPKLAPMSNGGSYRPTTTNTITNGSNEKVGGARPQGTSSSSPPSTARRPQHDENGDFHAPVGAYHSSAPKSIVIHTQPDMIQPELVSSAPSPSESLPDGRYLPNQPSSPNFADTTAMTNSSSGSSTNIESDQQPVSPSVVMAPAARTSLSSTSTSLPATASSSTHPSNGTTTMSTASSNCMESPISNSAGVSGSVNDEIVLGGSRVGSPSSHLSKHSIKLPPLTRMNSQPTGMSLEEGGK